MSGHITTWELQKDRIVVKIKNMLSFITILLLVLVLTGCVKFHINVKVNPDGSSTTGLALGVTDQVKALAGSQGVGDPFATLSEEFAKDANNPEVTLNRWTEGDYEWVEGVVSFDTLDELNTRMQEIGLFNSFEITKQSGLLNDTYILDAEIAPSAFTSDMSSEIDFDPSGMFDIRMTVSLPGEIVESNGINEGSKDSSSLSWTLTSGKALKVHAVSEYTNWTRGTLLVVGILTLVVGALSLIVIGILLLRRKRAPEKVAELTVPFNQ